MDKSTNSYFNALLPENSDKWLESGDYASRPPKELHGPFKTDVECIVLEHSYPNQSVKEN
jgi:hypothetical protein